jgi:hypothetical protein
MLRKVWFKNEIDRGQVGAGIDHVILDVPIPSWTIPHLDPDIQAIFTRSTL